MRFGNNPGTSLARIAVISAAALVVGAAGATLFSALDLLILAMPFIMLMTAAGWALVIVGLLAAFRRWGGTSNARSSAPTRSTSA
jgi:protein-S-isoprenylcysteine O-methyltransferase Ste14